VPVWPKVFGIIAIVFASYGLLSQLVGLVMAAPMSAVFERIGAPSPFDGGASRFIYLNGAGLLLLSGLLLAGGIALVRRRPAARRLLLSWAAARIAFAALIAPAQFAYTASMFSKVSSMPLTVGPPAAGSSAPAAAPSGAPAPGPSTVSPGAPAPLPIPVREMAVMGTVFGILMGCFLPLMTLIGLFLPKVVHQMRGWATPEQQDSPMPNLY
jgi:hypothetical protein